MRNTTVLHASTRGGDGHEARELAMGTLSSVGGFPLGLRWLGD